MPKYQHDNFGDVMDHIFAKGIITSVDSENDLADVTVEGYQDGSDVPLFYHCEPDSEERSNGAIEGAAAAFSVDDEVIVMLEVNGAPVRIVGFVDGIKSCCLFTELYPYDEEKWAGLWPVTSWCNDGWEAIPCDGFVTSSFTFDGETTFVFDRGGCGGHGTPDHVQVYHQQNLNTPLNMKGEELYFLLDIDTYSFSFSGQEVPGNNTYSYVRVGLIVARISNPSITPTLIQFFGPADAYPEVTHNTTPSGSYSDSGIFYINILDVIKYHFPEEPNLDDWQIKGFRVHYLAAANATLANCNFLVNGFIDFNSIKVCGALPTGAKLPAYSGYGYG